MNRKKKTQLFLFTAGLFMALYVTEKLFDYFLRCNYDFKTSYVSSGKINADILFQGTSRVLYMMNPAIVTEKTGYSCYNSGVLATDIKNHITMLSLYLEHNRKPRYIFQEITPYYLGKDRDAEYPSFNYIPYLDDEIISGYVSRFDKRLSTLNHFPLMKYSYYNSKVITDVIAGFTSCWRGSKERKSANGFEYLDREWDGKWEAFKKANPNGYEVKVDTTILNLYSEYIQLVKSQNIPLIFYEAPVWSESLPFTLNRPQMLAVIDSLCQANSVLFLKFDTLEMCRHKEYFFNSTHTTPQGTDIFSGIFSDYISRCILNKH